MIHTTAIEGLLLCDLTVHGDNRGWFKENWQRTKQVAAGLPDFRPVQNNISYNAEPGVTRGLHAEPWDKYVSVASGRVFGAWCDLREGSPTYGVVVTATITPDRAVFVPCGVANGFQALEATAYTYLVTDHWSPSAEYSFVNLADPVLRIDWPIPLEEAELSEKDRAHPYLVDTTPVPPKKILITGGGGQLATALAALLPAAEVATKDDLDITTDLQGARDWAQYSVIINTAAYTAVDAAETDRAAAWAVNATAVGNLAQVANEYNLTLVHVSSDYVFDGHRDNHREDEAVSPVSVYGQSKAAGDLAAATARDHLIARTSWVVGHGANFVATMATLADNGVNPTVVADQYGRLTFADDLAAAIVHLLQGGHRGVVNISNDGPTASWADIAAATFTGLGADPARVTPVTTAEYFGDKPHAPRPTHSTLDLSRLKKAGYQPRDWRDALTDYLKDRS